MAVKKGLTHESGQALILVVVALVVLFGFMALAIDVGSLYANRRKMQKAADAGALAGAMVLCKDGVAAARTAAVSMARANGAQLQDADITFPDGQTVSVPVSTTGNSIFGRILNPSFGTTAVGANATAQCGCVGSYGSGLAPITVQDIGYQQGVTYDLFEKNGPGNFGWLTWDGTNNANTLVDEILFIKNSDLYRDGAVPGKISVGDWLEGLPGVTNKAKDALITYVGKVLIIPVYHETRGNGSNFDYRVVGFAAFRIGVYDSSKKILPGEFIDMVTSTTSTNGQNYGVYGSKLVQSSAYSPTSVASTAVPPTAVPPTAVPPTAVPPTAVPPTAVPPTAVPPTAVPPTAVPPTAVPPTAVPPTAVPPTQTFTPIPPTPTSTPIPPTPTLTPIPPTPTPDPRCPKNCNENKCNDPYNGCSIYHCCD